MDTLASSALIGGLISYFLPIEDNSVNYEITCAEILGMMPDYENKSDGYLKFPSLSL